MVIWAKFRLELIIFVQEDERRWDINKPLLEADSVAGAVWKADIVSKPIE